MRMSEWSSWGVSGLSSRLDSSRELKGRRQPEVQHLGAALMGGLGDWEGCAVVVRLGEGRVLQFVCATQFGFSTFPERCIAASLLWWQLCKPERSEFVVRAGPSTYGSRCVLHMLAQVGLNMGFYVGKITVYDRASKRLVTEKISPTLVLAMRNMYQTPVRAGQRAHAPRASGMQNRTFGPYLAAMHRILIPLM
jgi:hypothetical protein